MELLQKLPLTVTEIDFARTQWIKTANIKSIQQNYPNLVPNPQQPDYHTETPTGLFIDSDGLLRCSGKIH